MIKPDKVPEKGFYYHYKHDPFGPINNYAYEFMGAGCHTEEDTLFAVYRPLYEAFVYTNGKLFDIRPLTMWMENVTKDGKTFPRFQKIIDPEVVAELEIIKNKSFLLNPEKRV